jgi:DNA-binding transcriptional regulator YiaG
MQEIMSPAEIEKLRLDLGQSIKVFTKETLGVSHTTYHNWMNGTTKPMMLVLHKLLKLKEETKNKRSLFSV